MGRAMIGALRGSWRDWRTRKAITPAVASTTTAPMVMAMMTSRWAIADAVPVASTTARATRPSAGRIDPSSWVCVPAGFKAGFSSQFKVFGMLGAVFQPLDAVLAAFPPGLAHQGGGQVVDGAGAEPLLPAQAKAPRAAAPCLLGRAAVYPASVGAATGAERVEVQGRGPRGQGDERGEEQHGPRGAVRGSVRGGGDHAAPVPASAIPWA